MNNELLIIFIALNIVNVIIQTVKSLATVKCGKTVAAIVNAVAYGLYTVVVVYTVCDLPLWLKVAVVGLANLIGVYVVKLFEEKARKDKLWVFCATIKNRSDNDGIDTVIAMLDNAKIKYVYNTVVPNKLFTMQIFSYNQKESAMITQILKNYNIKYYITETK